MKLLAIDTSSDACSVAVLCDEKVTSEHLVLARTHTRELIPMIRRQLAVATVSIADLDAIVLGNGPGSFIGMRIGASVAQGLAFAADLRIVPVSSLAAIAAEVFSDLPTEQVVVAQDARMGEVYRALFRRGDDGLPIEVGETVLQKIAVADAASGTHFAGGAWSRHPEMAANLRESATIVPIMQPNARFLLACGSRDLLVGKSIDPALLEPAYVRKTVAAIPGRKRVS